MEWFKPSCIWRPNENPAGEWGKGLAKVWCALHVKLHKVWLAANYQYGHRAWRGRAKMTRLWEHQQQQQKPDTRYVQLGQLFFYLVMQLSAWTYDGASEERDAARAVCICVDCWAAVSSMCVSAGSDSACNEGVSYAYLRNTIGVWLLIKYKGEYVNRIWKEVLVHCKCILVMGQLAAGVAAVGMARTAVLHAYS